MHVYDALDRYLRKPYYSPVYTSSASQHEAIKAQLYMLGFRLGYCSVLEARALVNGVRRQIDCLFVTYDGRAVCGIEIDGGAKYNSIAKLRTLPTDVEKIVISFGSENSYARGQARVAAASDARSSDVRIFRFRSWSTAHRTDWNSEED